MASSRHMRSSQRASPMRISTPNEISANNEALYADNHLDLSEEWEEPPLRPPAPSFEDYKGLERHGVLEHMAPLGTLPGSKVRARLKQQEGPRRAAHLKNGELRAAREDVNTPEPVAPVTARRSELRRQEEKARKASLPREKDVDHEYTPTLKSTARIIPAKPASLNTAPRGTPSSRTAQGRQKLREIVDSAVKRSSELGDPVLGDAVKELYEESLRNATVAELLDAVLTQKPSPQQTTEFQRRIRAARRKHKESLNSPDPVSKTIPASPITKTARSSVSRHQDPATIMSTSPSLSHRPSNPINASSKELSTTLEANGTHASPERPTKRVKRSKSTSSDSSLSSLDSAIDEEPPPTFDVDHASDQNPQWSKSQLSNGPRLGTFPIRPTDTSNRKSLVLHINSNLTAADEAAIKKREEMRRKFNRSVNVRESAIRSSPSPLLSPLPTPPAVPSTDRHLQGRLRNVSGQRRKKEDYEAIESPASSGFGDLLIPPPGPSRGVTPNQLGRPPKGIKKAARIKMS